MQACPRIMALSADVEKGSPLPVRLDFLVCRRYHVRREEARREKETRSDEVPSAGGGGDCTGRVQGAPEARRAQAGQAVAAADAGRSVRRGQGEVPSAGPVPLRGRPLRGGGSPS